MDEGFRMAIGRLTHKAIGYQPDKENFIISLASMVMDEIHKVTQLEEK